MKPESRKRLRIFLWILGVPLAFLILIFVGMTLVDLYGPAPFVDIPKEQVAKALARVNASPTIVRSLRAAKITTSSLSGLRTMALVTMINENDRRGSETLSAPMAAVIPESSATTRTRERARKLNADCLTLAHSIEDYYQRQLWLDQAGAFQLLLNAQNDYNRLQREFYPLEMEVVQDRYKTVAGFETRPEYSEAISRMLRLGDAIEWADLMLCLFYERYDEAAFVVRRSRMNTWATEVFIYRNEGPGGRAKLARRSAERNWKALKRSFLSIGPDFQLPHRERLD